MLCSVQNTSLWQINCRFGKCWRKPRRIITVLKQLINGGRLKTKICPHGPREKEKYHKVFQVLDKYGAVHSLSLGLMGELYSRENYCIDRGQDQWGIIEHRVACQVYLKSLPLLLSHVCLCLGENHASVKEATGVKGAVCVLLVAALSIV